MGKKLERKKERKGGKLSVCMRERASERERLNDLECGRKGNIK